MHILRHTLGFAFCAALVLTGCPNDPAPTDAALDQPPPDTVDAPPPTDGATESC